MDAPMLAPREPINGGPMRADSSAPAPEAAPRRAARSLTACRLLSQIDRREWCMCCLATLSTGVASLTSMALPVFTGELVSAVTTDDGGTFCSFDDSCKGDALAGCRRACLTQVLLIMGIAFAVSGVSLGI
eukprot:1685017-Prymnesium_polylepis.1